jgi:hypothetical protein
VPAAERARLATEREAMTQQGWENRQNTASRQACMADASVNYLLDWAAECQARRLPVDCTLPVRAADRFEDRRDRAQRLCLQQYPPE